MRGGVLLEQRLHAVLPGRIRADDLPRDSRGAVQGGLLIARELDDEPAPLLVLFRIGLGGVLRHRLQSADRVQPRPRHPVLLGIADRHVHHGLGPADAHLTRQNGSAQERALPQLPRESDHLLGGAGIEPELFPGIVADAGIAEPEHALPLAQPVEPLADGDVDPSATAREWVEDAFEAAAHGGADGLVALAGHGPREHRRYSGEGVEEAVVRVGRMNGVFSHTSGIPDPSDIPRWAWLRLGVDVDVDGDGDLAVGVRMDGSFAHVSWIAPPSDIPRSDRSIHDARGTSPVLRRTECEQRLAACGWRA